MTCAEQPCALKNSWETERVQRDEIVEEVRAVRAELLASVGGDLEALFAKLAALEANEKRQVVVLPPRKASKKGDVA